MGSPDPQSVSWQLFDVQSHFPSGVVLRAGAVGSDQDVLRAALHGAAGEVQSRMYEARREALASPPAQAWRAAEARLAEHRARLADLRRQREEHRLQAGRAVLAGGDPSPHQRAARTLADEVADLEELTASFEKAATLARQEVQQAVQAAVRAARCGALRDARGRADRAREALRDALAAALTDLLAGEAGVMAAATEKAEGGICDLPNPESLPRG